MLFYWVNLLKKTGLTHAHLKGIKLADHSTGYDDVMMDILLYSFNEWYRIDGQTASQTKLGWVLSGPLDGVAQTEN